MATFSTFKKLLQSSDCHSEIIECGLEVDWSAEYDNEDNHCDCDLDIGDILSGLYWHCVDSHSGQFSDAYKLQCILRDIYTPGRMESGPKEDTGSWDVYVDLNLVAHTSQAK